MTSIGCFTSIKSYRSLIVTRSSRPFCGYFYIYIIYWICLKLLFLLVHTCLYLPFCIPWTKSKVHASFLPVCWRSYLLQEIQLCSYVLLPGLFTIHKDQTFNRSLFYALHSALCMGTDYIIYWRMFDVCTLLWSFLQYIFFFSTLTSDLKNQIKGKHGTTGPWKSSSNGIHLARTLIYSVDKSLTFSYSRVTY